MESTKQKLKDAFIKLYEEKSTRQITIKDISETANIYRGTFYYYYDDIYALYDDIQNDVISIAKNNILPLVMNLISGNMAGQAPLVSSLYGEYENIIRLFIVEKPDSKTINEIKKVISHTVLSKFNLSEEQLPDELRYMLEFVSSGQISVIGLWITEGRSLEVEKLFQVMRINLSGFLKFVSSFASGNSMG